MTKDKPNRFFFGIVALISVPIGLAGAYGVKAVQSHHLISIYLSSHAVKKLQIGAAGAKGFDDWLNTDIEPQAGEAYLDATKPFPIPSCHTSSPSRYSNICPIAMACPCCGNLTGLSSRAVRSASPRRTRCG